MTVSINDTVKIGRKKYTVSHIRDTFYTLQGADAEDTITASFVDAPLDKFVEGVIQFPSKK